MDMFQETFKVNMGNKKDLTKEQLLQQSRKERAQREVVRKQSEAATMIQKMLRGYKANQLMQVETIDNPSLKIKDTIIALTQLQQKHPEKSAQIFVKGLDKHRKQIVQGLNNVSRTMGSILFPQGNQNVASQGSRIEQTYTKLQNGYEKFLLALLQMMNEQHAMIESQNGQNSQIIDNVVAIRQALFKFSLRYLVWNFAVEKVRRRPALSTDLLQAMIQFLTSEANCRSSNVLFQTLRSEMYLSKSSLLALEHLSNSQLVTKQCIKLTMVYMIEKSLTSVLSEAEYSLLNTMRLLVCNSQIFTDQIEKVEVLVVDHDYGLKSYDQVGAKYMSAVVDKALQQEKDVDNHLMQLSLVDITGTINSAHKFKILAGSIEDGLGIQTNNVVIEHIYNAKASFKMVQKIIKMKSTNYLKPFQLSTVMTYVETLYHSNDYQFLRIMAELLNVAKIQIRYWKDQRIQNQQDQAQFAQQKMEEFKLQQEAGQIDSSTQAAPARVRMISPDEVDASSFIAISETLARQQVSLMIGEKVIGKIFNDNLNDFNDNQQDMEPIMNICAIITKVLVILKELDVKQRAQIESQVLYRSNILNILFQYVHKTYKVKSFSNQNVTDNEPIMKQVREDEELLNLFCFIVQKRLIVMDDLEFQGEKSSQKQAYPFIPYAEVRHTSWILNNIAYRVFLSHGTLKSFTREFLENIKKAITALYDRDKRLKINPENFWIVEKDILERLDHLDYKDISSEVSHTILIEIPHTIPFSLRAKIFQHLIGLQRQHYGGYIHPIRINRSTIFEDSYHKIFQQKFNMKNQLAIKFVNDLGMEEDGIDGGGLFKEFITKLCDKIFDPEYAFFRENDQDRKLMPQHTSKQFDNYQSMYKFFGMIVGKAMFDGCLLKCTFAKTFLNRICKKANRIDDLKEVDKQVYDNLMYTKYYEGDVEDLCLYMCYTDSSFGAQTTVDLTPGGSEILVTQDNKMQYIMMYANFLLNKKDGAQTKAFVEGMHEVIDPQLLSMFFPDEIQLLISGGLNEIDIRDLQKNVQYNGYSQNDSYIKEFWSYLDSLPNKQKEKFLLFVTGSDRPPLLGFKYMNPQMMIARDHADGGDPKNRFPTAATCMNMLRLPKYRTKEDMKRTIDYVINSNQGFGLG